jgi:hypothetical protein
MNELVKINPGADVQAYRASTEAAEICKEIVIATSSNIQGRRYVSVEGWQAIAIAHGCAAGSRDVEKIDGGVRAIGEIRRMSDGQLIATAEGFVGEDETTWYGGKDKRGRQHDKRADYAIRAMAQTRAISRACRSAFAHVVVMMNAGLATTPAEEVPFEGFDRDTGEVFEAIPTNEPAARQKLDGPHTSKTALKAAVGKLVRAVEAAQTVEMLDQLKDEFKQTINQALRDWPELINGDPNVEEDIGLKGAFERRRTELTPGSLNLQMLLSVLETCATRNDLNALLEEHGAVAEELDGEESRAWQTAFNAHEAAIMAVAPVSAG